MDATQYFNDDPFSRIAPAGFHWKFRHALPAYRCPFRLSSPQCRAVSEGRGNSRRALSADYDPRRHFIDPPLPDPETSLPTPRSSVIGENDWRVDCLDALVAGLRPYLKGGGWDRAVGVAPSEG